MAVTNLFEENLQCSVVLRWHWKVVLDQACLASKCNSDLFSV